MSKSFEKKKIRVLRLLHRNPFLSLVRLQTYCSLGNEGTQILKEMLSAGLLNIMDDDAGSHGLYSITSKGVKYMRG